MNHIFTDNNSAQIAFRVGLPLGISFYTFKAISYSVDVYKKAIPSERKFIDFACYLIIFPEISAGPIDRYKDLQKNIKKKDLSLDNFYYGIKRFIIGLAKKVIIANTLSITTDQIFSIPGNHLTFSLAWLGIICYTLQIYYDFSGYTDMAIGLGRVMGFKFAENFNYPYISISITEFWKRWHITLSNWFRDYVYFPIEGKHLGMNPKGEHVTYLNLMITFVLCGFWHGASWGFILWGAFHGLFIIFERMTGIIFWRPNSNRVLKHSYFLFIISLSWVFFRANSVRYALSFVKTMFGFGEGNNEIFYPSMYISGELMAVIIIGALFSVPVLKYIQNLKIINNFKRNEKLMTSYNYASGIIEIIVYVILILLCYSSVAVSTHNPFIYFRF